MPALIVMPSDAPGGEGRGHAAGLWRGDQALRPPDPRTAWPSPRPIAAERGSIVVPAFDDPHIIAGQGTVGLELVRQAKAASARAFDVVVSPVGGGGLMAGVSTAVKALSPTTALVGVEPAGFDDTLRSLQKGERIVTKPSTRFASGDALETPRARRDHLPDPAEKRGRHRRGGPTPRGGRGHALRLLGADAGGGARRLRPVWRPCWRGKVARPGATRRTGLVSSGANVDPDLFARGSCGKEVQMIRRASERRLASHLGDPGADHPRPARPMLAPRHGSKEARPAAPAAKPRRLRERGRRRVPHQRPTSSGNAGGGGAPLNCATTPGGGQGRGVARATASTPRAGGRGLPRGRSSTSWSPPTSAGVALWKGLGRCRRAAAGRPPPEPGRCGGRRWVMLGAGGAAAAVSWW